jgi:hypothetical protein
MSKDSIKARVTAISKKLPDQAQDQYYESQASRIDTIIGGDTQNFARLHLAKKEWDRLADAVPVGQGFLTFDDYMREYYGIKLTMNHKYQIEPSDLLNAKCLKGSKICILLVDGLNIHHLE